MDRLNTLDTQSKKHRDELQSLLSETNQEEKLRKIQDNEKKRNFLFNSHIMNIKFIITEKVHKTASLKDISLSAKDDKDIALEDDDRLFDENGKYDVYELTAIKQFLKGTLLCKKLQVGSVATLCLVQGSSRNTLT